MKPVDSSRKLGSDRTVRRSTSSVVLGWPESSSRILRERGIAGLYAVLVDAAHAVERRSAHWLFTRSLVSFVALFVYVTLLAVRDVAAFSSTPSWEGLWAREPVSLFWLITIVLSAGLFLWLGSRPILRGLVRNYRMSALAVLAVEGMGLGAAVASLCYAVVGYGL